MLARILLAILNSRWINKTPCEYGFVNNLEAFSHRFLQCEVEMRPDVTVQQILEDVERWNPRRAEHLTAARLCVLRWEAEHNSHEHLIEHIADLLDTVSTQPEGGSVTRHVESHGAFSA